jgi:hypothetical protein
LYAGGYFNEIGETAANGIARWDGSRWQSLGQGVGQHGTVEYLAAHRNDVYVTGKFHQAGPQQVFERAHWNGANWSTLGTEPMHSRNNPIAVADSGVYSAMLIDGPWGDHVAVVKWDGARWVAVTTQITWSVDWAMINALIIDGTNIYAGGVFESAGSTKVNNVAVWNGTRWSALDGGLNGIVYDMALSGNNLYVGGEFTQAGDIAARYIARWDGSQWSALGAGAENPVTAVAATGDTAYAVTFSHVAGNDYDQRILKWDGAQWSSLGLGIPAHPDHEYVAPIADLAISPSSGRIYVGGGFNRVIDGTTAHPTNVAANNIAVWDGTRWSALGSGVNGRVNALVASGNNLYIGGSFTEAGGHAAYSFTRWTERLVTYLPVAASTTR